MPGPIIGFQKSAQSVKSAGIRDSDKHLERIADTQVEHGFIPDDGGQVIIAWDEPVPLQYGSGVIDPGGNIEAGDEEVKVEAEAKAGPYAEFLIKPVKLE